MNTAGDRVAVSSSDGIDTRIITYQRQGKDWIHYGNEIIKKDCYIESIHLSVLNKFIDLSDGGKVMMVNYSYTLEPKPQCQLYILVGDRWQAVKITDYDRQKYARLPIGDITSDGRTLVMAMVAYIRTDASYIAVYYIDTTSGIMNEQPSVGEIYLNPVQDVLHIVRPNGAPYAVQVVSLDGITLYSGLSTHTSDRCVPSSSGMLLYQNHSGSAYREAQIYKVILT